jgi:hypothetical protein
VPGIPKASCPDALNLEEIVKNQNRQKSIAYFFIRLFQKHCAYFPHEDRSALPLRQTGLSASIPRATGACLVLKQALIFFFLCGVPFLQADPIYGKINAVTTVKNGSSPSESLSVHLEDNWGIILGEDYEFLRGVEIRIDIPSEASLYAGTYAVFVYKKVNPVPEVNQSSYQGSLLFFKVVEERRRLFIQIPIGSASGFTNAPDTYIHKTPLAASDFPLLFAVLPIMKGIPEQAAKALFHAEVHPLFKNMGKLLLSLPDGEQPGPQIRVFVDDKNQTYTAEGILLAPGIRKVRIEKPGFAPFAASIGIDKGQTSVLEVSFLAREASLRINAPTGTRAFLDGKAIALENMEMTVEAGEHTLSMKLGDYQISKRFSVETGKTYSASLSLDILVNED